MLLNFCSHDLAQWSQDKPSHAKPSGEAEDAARVAVEVEVEDGVELRMPPKLTFNKTYLLLPAAAHFVVIDIIIISNCYGLDKFVLWQVAATAAATAADRLLQQNLNCRLTHFPSRPTSPLRLHLIDGKANIIFALRSSEPWSLASSSSSSFTSSAPFANKFMLISCILRSSSDCADIIIARGRVFRHANQSISFHRTGNSMACYKENAAYPTNPPTLPLSLTCLCVFL